MKNQEPTLAERLTVKPPKFFFVLAILGGVLTFISAGIVGATEYAGPILLAYKIDFPAGLIRFAELAGYGASLVATVSALAVDNDALAKSRILKNILPNAK